MPNTLSETFHNFLHLFFPHVCEGCGTDILDNDTLLCAACHAKLPETNFLEHSNNLVEQKFYGQLKVEAAGAAFYFTKEGLLQLERALHKAPKLVKKFVELNPSILQNQQVVDMLAKFRRNKKN